MPPIHPFSIDNHWLQSITQYRKEYVTHFNELTKKKKESPISASAKLFQIKEGIEKLITDNQDAIQEKLKVIIDYLESEVKNNEEGRDLAKLILSASKHFHEPDTFKKSMVLQSNFEMGLKRYYNEYGGEYWHISDVYLGHIVDLKKEINEYSAQVSALESLLKEVITKKYPKKLKALTLQEVKEDVTGERGRNYDESAPQDDIEEFVKNAVKKAKAKEPGYKKYWHFSGPHQGTPNKLQLQQGVKEANLTGILGDEAIRDRVNKALSSLGY